jgi:hypothetical protein
METMWDQIADDMGWNDTNMLRSRPFNGQPHTDTGQRGATEICGITFRDLRDCFIRAYCLSLGGTTVKNQAHYEEALKGERAALCENDLFQLDGQPDPIAVCQNLSCEIERLMGIFPNVPKLKRRPPSSPVNQG